MELTYQTSYIPKELFSLELKQTTKILLLFISSFRNGFFMSIEQVVNSLGISRSAIFKAKKELEERALIKHEIINSRDALKVNWAQITILRNEQKKCAQADENCEFNFTYSETSQQLSTDCNYISDNDEDQAVQKINSNNFTDKVQILDSENKNTVHILDSKVPNMDSKVQILDTYIQVNKTTYKFYNLNCDWYCIKYDIKGKMLEVYNVATMEINLLKRLYSAYLKIRKANANNAHAVEQKQTNLFTFTIDDLKNAIKKSYAQLSDNKINYIANEMFDFYTKDGRNFRVGYKTLTIKDIAKKAYFWVKKLKINSNDRKVIEKPATILQPSALPSKPANAHGYDEDLRQTILKMSSNRPELLLKNKNGVDMLIRAGFDISSLKQSA